MSMQDQKIHDDAKDAVQDELDIRERVRAITMRALTERSLDKEGIQAVVRSVSSGVIEGLDFNREHAGAVLKEAVSGMDEALGKSAEAARLATQEALGRTGEFADSEFKNALEQLKGLEQNFVDTLSTVAEQTSRFAGDSFKDLVTHLKRNGTDTGIAAKSAVSSLQEELAKVGKVGLDSAMTTGKQVGTQIAQIASGILAGMAEALAKDKKTR